MHFSFFQIALMAIVTMTVFLQTEMHYNSVIDGGIYAGALFFGNLGLMLNGFAELSMTVVRLPVFYKQRDLLFYPSWAYGLPSWILKIPVTFSEAAVGHSSPIMSSVTILKLEGKKEIFVYVLIKTCQVFLNSG
jgi:hypothetical protein